MEITNTLHQQKTMLLDHLRSRATESFGEVERTYGVQDYRKRSDLINKKIFNSSNNIKTQLFQQSINQSWSKDDLLKNMLMLTYCTYVVMIEFRNRAWQYEYMTFSRRIGELWEPFCKLCFSYPIRTDVELFEPPLFAEVKEILQTEIRTFINNLNIENEEKLQLLAYYDKVWSLVTSGEIKLELDLHFRLDGRNFNVDFKSGFQSNEKGNTNRLLLVASIYKNIIAINNECLLFVRADEADNNNYLKTIKRSGIWDVYCGHEAYTKIQEFTGFNLSQWIEDNIKWEDDLAAETHSIFIQNDLVKYLSW